MSVAKSDRIGHIEQDMSDFAVLTPTYGINYKRVGRHAVRACYHVGGRCARSDLRWEWCWGGGFWVEDGDVSVSSETDGLPT